MNPIFLAIDTSRYDTAVRLLDQVGDTVGGIKIGLQFFIANGPAAVSLLTSTGVATPRKLFLDLKLHDIPNTVAGAIESLAAIDADFTTLHCLGDLEMLRTARRARDQFCPKTKLLGVTVLTSLPASPDDVARLAQKAVAAGLDGVVCSGHEITRLRQEFGSVIDLMVPGIRSRESRQSDQKRTTTAAEALARGANYLVVGRDITDQSDPKAAAEAIFRSLNHKLRV